MKYYFIKKNGKQFGPIAFEHLIEQGVTKNTLIWFEGCKDWIEAGLVEELVPLFIQDPQSLLKEGEVEENTVSMNGWAVVFWVVAFLSVLDYFVRVIPKFQNAGLSGFAVYFGGFMPNFIVILIFWFIMRGTDKKRKRSKESK